MPRPPASYRRIHPRDVAEASVVVVVALLATVLAALGWVPLLAQGETWFADLRSTLMARADSGEQDFHDDIVIIAIRDSSLAKFGYLSPVDRGLLADAVEALAAKGARAVGLDILFDRPTEPEKDLRLRQALLGFPGPVVVAYADAAQGLGEAGAAYLRAFSDGLGRGWPNVLRQSREGTVRWMTTTLDVPGDVTDGLAAALARALGYPVPEGRPRLDFRVGAAIGESPFRIYPIETVGLLKPRRATTS